MLANSHQFPWGDPLTSFSRLSRVKLRLATFCPTGTLFSILSRVEREYLFCRRGELYLEVGYHHLLLGKPMLIPTPFSSSSTGAPIHHTVI